MTRTPITRLPWLIRTCFFSSNDFFPPAQENKYLGVVYDFSYFIMKNACCVNSLEAILMSTLKIPLFYRRSTKHPYIIPICLLTWRYN